MRFRPSLWLTIFSAASFVVLCGLGTWQVQRLQWKLGLISEIQAGRSAAPRSLPQKLTDAPGWRFRMVTATGTFQHHAESHRTGKTENGKVGYRVFTPLLRKGGETIMVERGWVPEDLKDPATRAAGQAQGVVTVTGMIRLPDPRNYFTPPDNVVKNEWFAVDPRAMGAAAGVTVPGWYVVDEASALDWPRAGPSELNLKNNHLGYAVTWYALAAALLAIWLIMGFRRGQDPAT
jgi:surfeit locus 1 family protein